ncbi:MAG: ligase-associated DNA damage response endonuclease PdeM [Sneathiellaceae bacterium]
MILNGEVLLPHLSGALWWPGARTAIFADLHFEKGSAAAARGGALLPPYDTRANLSRIAAVLRQFRPDRVICLGDSFHDRAAPGRLDDGDLQRLRALMDGLDWIWITGNHDPEVPHWLGGRSAPELQLGRLVFRHEPLAGTASGGAAEAAGEIVGHFHPKARVQVRGRAFSRRCFATDGQRLVMPAFGAYTGGLDVLDPAFHAVLARTFHAWMLGAREVFPVPAARLVPIA